MDGSRNGAATPARRTGYRGEDIACAYLKKKGYRWLVSNYYSRWGEIDLIMEDGATLVFVEVKHRAVPCIAEPEEAVTPAKIRRIVRSALDYIQTTGCVEKMVRFDVVSVGTFGIRHYADAFTVSDSEFYH